MGKYFKSDSNLRVHEPYPILNRILHSLFLVFALLFVFWPVPLIVSVFSWIFWEFMSENFRLGLKLTCISIFLIIAIYIFITEKYKPSDSNGTYTPGTEPNFNKYHSPEWYMHEQNMKREREDAERERRSKND